MEPNTMTESDRLKDNEAVCVMIANDVNEGKTQKACERVKANLDSSVDIGTDRYNEVKERAKSADINERPDYWMELLPEAAHHMDEFKFVAANLLYTLATSFDGMELKNQPTAFRAAGTLFNDCNLNTHQTKARARRLNVSGHLAMKDGEFEVAGDSFATAKAIFDNHRNLDPRHFYATNLRDLVRARTRHLVDSGDIEGAIAVADEMAGEFDRVESDVGKFRAQVEAREHELRAMLAEKSGQSLVQMDHLETCIERFEAGGRRGVAQKKRDALESVRSDLP